MNIDEFNNLQMNALREALECAAGAVRIAEGRAARAMGDLQVERGRCACAEQTLKETAARLEAAIDENRRLRELIGNVCKDRAMMERDAREMLQSGAAPDVYSHEVPDEPLPAQLHGHRVAA